MAALIIIACILLALLGLMLMRIRVQLTFADGKINAYLRVLFLKIKLYSDKKSKIKKSDYKIKKFRRRRDKVLKKYRIKKASKKPIKKGTQRKQRSPLALINSLKIILGDSLRLFGKYHRIEKFKVKITVGGADAAKTAINYGYVISSLQFLVTFLEGFGNLDKTKNKSASVVPDFGDGKWGADVDIIEAVRVIHILKIGFAALKGYLKSKNVNKPKKTAENKMQGAKGL